MISEKPPNEMGRNNTTTTTHFHVCVGFIAYLLFLSLVIISAAIHLVLKRVKKNENEKWFVVNKRAV